MKLRTNPEKSICQIKPIRIFLVDISTNQKAYFVSTVDFIFRLISDSAKSQEGLVPAAHLKKFTKNCSTSGGDMEEEPRSKLFILRP